MQKHLYVAVIPELSENTFDLDEGASRRRHLRRCRSRAPPREACLKRKAGQLRWEREPFLRHLSRGGVVFGHVFLVHVVGGRLDVSLLYLFEKLCLVPFKWQCVLMCEGVIEGVWEKCCRSSCTERQTARERLVYCIDRQVTKIHLVDVLRELFCSCNPARCLAQGPDGAKFFQLPFLTAWQPKDEACGTVWVTGPDAPSCNAFLSFVLCPLRCGGWGDWGGRRRRGSHPSFACAVVTELRGFRLPVDELQAMDILTATLFMPLYWAWASHEQDHSLVSVEGGLYSCRQCTYVTKSKGNMKRHLRIHTGERPFQCLLCPAAFTEKRTLKDHIRTHTGERPFSCDQCNASFAMRASLVSHMRTHTGDRPFSCDKCSASFSQRTFLKAHMITHTGERPFSCDFCNASYSRKGHLMDHMQKHAGQRPFCCDHCSASFSLKTDFVNHMHTHTGERPFSCDQCSASFGQKGFWLTTCAPTQA
ncbi:hypothetical protein HPB51_028164 [Rhipicephalus microplus]|uniref:C2H2-type domain-containing protein n=1 Tax=Rhipicephalus microplus TaxID=6941 RepID=A0A9J6CXR6_RHIMP|nr:hypothetical protein HPB51_028164 [Rhipicephalus microplus]